MTWWCSAQPDSSGGSWPATWPAMRRTGCRIGLAGRSARAAGADPLAARSGGRAVAAAGRRSADPPSVEAMARAAQGGRDHGGAVPSAGDAAGAGLRSRLARTTRTCPARCCSCGRASTAAMISAASTGTRIVHCCGFDSIPSDLGVLAVHEAPALMTPVTWRIRRSSLTAMKGGVSGGTLASGMGQFKEMAASAQSRRLVQDPYALSPDRPGEPILGDQRDLEWARYDADLGIWISPFVMAGLNTRVVRRSNALQNWAYGRRFRYREVTGFGSGRARGRAGHCARRRGEVADGGHGVLAIPGAGQPAARRCSARVRARRPAATGSSGWRSTPVPPPARGTSARSRPPATLATRRRR